MDVLLVILAIIGVVVSNFKEQKKKLNKTQNNTQKVKEAFASQAFHTVGQTSNTASVPVVQMPTERANKIKHTLKSDKENGADKKAPEQKDKTFGSSLNSRLLDIAKEPPKRFFQEENQTPFANKKERQSEKQESVSVRQEKPSLSLSQEELLRGIIFSEILQRPQDRKPVWRKG